MYGKEYYIRHIQRSVIDYNEYWEDPITESRLVKNPKQTSDVIKGLCQLIKTYYDNDHNAFAEKDFDHLPDEVKVKITEIINMVSDGRDLRHEVFYEKVGRRFAHHVEDNGRLPFENNPLNYVSNIIEDCEKLKQAVLSDEAVVDLEKWCGKLLEWEHYEDGSYVIRIDRIGQEDNGKMIFDGAILHYLTPDCWLEKDGGVVMEEVEDYPFENIPYPYVGKMRNAKDLDEYLSGGKEITLKQLKKDVMFAMTNYFDSTFGDPDYFDDEEEENDGTTL